ncbi:MAG: hypothetical protein Pg6C_17500 [Treponemataceae bacterium]|nr:MAG: hypothetical protein Pg6C_17500 [Treponemataceae bacterium]
MRFSEFFRNRSYVAQIIFIVVILYTVSSINVLVLAMSLVPHLERSYLHPASLIGFAVISFVLTVMISAYHVYTMIYRKKRKTDSILNQPAAA